jgi:hypothetical protein
MAHALWGWTNAAGEMVLCSKTARIGAIRARPAVKTLQLQIQRAMRENSTYANVHALNVLV